MGGGEQTFRANPLQNDTDVCFRDDGADLIWDWMQYQKDEKRNYQFVSDRKSLLSVDPSVDHLLGIFSIGVYSSRLPLIKS